MILENEDDPIFQDASKMSASLGFSLVDLAVRNKDNRVMVSAILTGPEGFGIAECAKVHRLLMPRLEVVFDQKDVYLEVSSPGLERVFRHQREFEAFEGKPIMYLQQGASEWKRAYLKSVQPEVLTLSLGKNEWTLDRRQIVKARLDMLGENLDNDD